MMPGTTLRDALRTAAFGAGTMLALGLLAAGTGAPLLFPSLGPTAFGIVHQPAALSSCPRNAVQGHALGVIAGWVGLFVGGLVPTSPAVQRSVAAAVALALTSASMLGLDRVHPPATATTLIVALGLMPTPWSGAVIPAAVALLCALGWAAHQLTGGGYPAWSPDPTR